MHPKESISSVTGDIYRLQTKVVFSANLWSTPIRNRINVITYCIFSLGVHTAGYVGERVDKIGRITALDPGR